MMSPVAAANPQARALPLPQRFWVTIRTPGAQPTGGGDGVVDGVPVDDDDLVQPVRQLREDMRQVAGLVQSGNDDRDLRPGLADARERSQIPA